MFNQPISALDPLPITYTTAITSEYLDIMGHMNMGWYGMFFAIAAREFTSQMGITEAYVQAGRGGAFMLKQFTRYVNELHTRDEVEIRSRALARTEKRYHYIHFMVNRSRGNLAAMMEAVSTHADLQARKSSPFTPEVAATIDRTIAEHNALGWAAPLSGCLGL